MSSYEHLEKEFKTHRRFNKLFGEVIETVHLNDKGRAYFWDTSIGYKHHDTSIDRMIVHMDLSLLNILRKSLVDIDNSIKTMYNVIESLTRVRIYSPISLNVPVVMASLLTNFFTAIPIKQEDGSNSYNLFYIEGDTPCITARGILHLKCYDSYDDCLMDASDRFDLSYHEDETFTAFMTHMPVSLTLFRVFFILTLLLKQGVTICEDNMEMDSMGRFRNSRRSRNSVSKRPFFGEASRTQTRPRQAEGEG